MNTTHSPQSWLNYRKAFVGTGLAAAVLLLGSAIWTMIGEVGNKKQPFVYYTTTIADLPLTVTERGNLESQLETEIRCMVENISVDRSGNYGTQIIFIVPDGSAVNTGDKLVELDSAAIRDRRDNQILACEKATSTRIQAQARYTNQEIQNKTLKAEAELKLSLAKLELESFMDTEAGSFKLEEEKIARDIDDQNTKILEARFALELAKTEKAGYEELFKLGYRGKGELDKVRMGFVQAEGGLAAATNRLVTLQASLRQLRKYDHEMQKLQLEGNVATAERSLEQVLVENVSLLAQSEAAKQEAEKTEEKEKERLEKLEQQLENCIITAPHDGMVVYARENSRYSSSTEIAEGATVRERQRILSLPDLSQMQVKTQVHEAVLDQVRPGLPATVRIDAFPDRVYQGVVHEVAVVPASSGWSGSSVKTYDTVVRIEGKVEQLKPGMTAVVEIHVDRIHDVVTVPVQAVVQIARDNWCYVETPNGVERRIISLGRSNDKFVHVTEGLAAGDRVVLNPMAILDESERKQNEIAPDAGAPDDPAAPARPVAENSPSTGDSANLPNASSEQVVQREGKAGVKRIGVSRAGKKKSARPESAE